MKYLKDLANEIEKKELTYISSDMVLLIYDNQKNFYTLPVVDLYKL